jgi:hypothetical protein
MVTGDSVEVIATNSDKTHSVKSATEFGVLLKGIRQEMLDLETDDRVSLRVDTGIDIVPIPMIERDARGWARLTEEVDEKRVGRSIVR